MMWFKEEQPSDEDAEREALNWARRFARRQETRTQADAELGAVRRHTGDWTVGDVLLGGKVFRA
jgi:hypothetical protein